MADRIPWLMQDRFIAEWYQFEPTIVHCLLQGGVEAELTGRLSTNVFAGLLGLD